MKKLKNKQKKQIYLLLPAILIVFLVVYLLISASNSISSDNHTNVRINEIPEENYRIDYVFWSDCGACYNLTLALNEYLAGKNFINLYKIPATGGGWSFDAKLYHTIEEIANDNKMHIRNIYNGYVNQIHSRNNPLRSPEQKISYLSDRLRVSVEDFEYIFNSPEVENRLRKSQSINNQLNVRSVPQLLINGRYKLDMQGYSSYQDIFDTIEEIFRNQ